MLRPLSFDNYEVALTEFKFNSLNNSVGFLCIRKFIGDDIAYTEMIK